MDISEYLAVTRQTLTAFAAKFEADALKINRLIADILGRAHDDISALDLDWPSMVRGHDLPDIPGAIRDITPMMTARFYDLPVMGWLMRVFGTIRVPDKALKKDAPEIQEAIAALDRGECVVSILEPNNGIHFNPNK